MQESPPLAMDEFHHDPIDKLDECVLGSLNKKRKRKRKSKKGNRAQPGYRLPLDVLELVAKFLAGERWQGSLATLDVTSHAVREITKPILYETVIFTSSKGREYLIDGAPLDSWKYTRFLHVTTDVREGLLEPIIRKLEALQTAPTNKRSTVHGLSKAFPSLVAAFTRREESPSTYRVKAEICLPITPATLMEVSVLDGRRRTLWFGRVFRDARTETESTFGNDHRSTSVVDEVITDKVVGIVFAATGEFYPSGDKHGPSWSLDRELYEGNSSPLALDLSHLKCDHNNNAADLRLGNMVDGLIALSPLRRLEEDNPSSKVRLYQFDITLADWCLVFDILRSTPNMPWRTAYRFFVRERLSKETTLDQINRLVELSARHFDIFSPILLRLELSMPIITVEGDLLPARDPPHGTRPSERKYRVRLGTANGISGSAHVLAFHCEIATFAKVSGRPGQMGERVSTKAYIFTPGVAGLHVEMITDWDLDEAGADGMRFGWTG